MTQHMSYNLNCVQSQKQTLRMMMSPQMQQALNLLQLPIAELAQVVELELDQNPILEPIEDKRDEVEYQEEDVEREVDFNEHDFRIMERLEEVYAEHFAQSEGGYASRCRDDDSLQAYRESSIIKQTSLYEHLMEQARQTFETSEDLVLATLLIGNFDERGFLQDNICEIAVSDHDVKRMQELLSEIQNFEPFGVGATSIQESLLIQMRCLGKKGSLAYAIIENHYDDLLHNRIPKIGDSLGCVVDEIKDAVQSHICPLDLRPGMQFSHHLVPYIKPDAAITLSGDSLVVVVEDDIVPPVRFNHRYLRMLESEHVSMEDKLYIREKILSAKWLIRTMSHRNSMIERITKTLAERQKEFFISQDGKMVPLTMKVLGEELGVHESTIARAVANKYLDTPRGLLPLRAFFSHTYALQDGHSIASYSVREIVHELIGHEDKSKPLSDAALSALLEAKGIICARRTVAKYRTELKLGNAQQRKSHGRK